MSISQNNYLVNNFYMRLAIAQAKKNLGNTKNNPSVGCVIANKNSIISAGCTGINGTPHAEYIALKSSKINLKDANMYVTLEPCTHFGKTPPCTNLIIKKKIKKVFFSINDPDIRVNNKCSIILKKNKISTIKGFCFNEINFLYRSYIKSKKDILPFVTCKIAVSKDYYTINKKKKWITNYFSRRRVHLLRSVHDCLISSYKTIKEDNSRFTCRIEGLENRSPSRIILDKNLLIPIKSKLFKESKKIKTIIFFNKNNKRKINILKKLNVQTYKIHKDESGNLDLYKSLIKAKKLGFHRIFIESGLKLTTSFLEKNLVDDIKLFISNEKLKKNGKNNIKNSLYNFLKNKKGKVEKVNLFGDTLISYKIK